MIFPRARARFAAVAVLVVAILALGPPLRRKWRAPPPRPGAATFAQAERVEIVRDTFGVPHVLGKSDGDAAFGLAYANAEDDWPTVQGVMAASPAASASCSARRRRSRTTTTGRSSA